MKTINKTCCTELSFIVRYFHVSSCIVLRCAALCSFVRYCVVLLQDVAEQRKREPVPEDLWMVKKLADCKFWFLDNGRGLCDCGSHSDTDRHRHTDKYRQTDTDRQTNIGRDRQTDKDRQTKTDTDRQTQTDRQTHRQTDTDRQKQREVQLTETKDRMRDRERGQKN